MLHGLRIRSIARAGWVCTLVLGLGLAACSFAEVDRPKIPVTITGDAKLVDAYKVSPWDYKSLDLSGSIGALGVGTMGKYVASGDMLSFTGRTFIRTTDPKAGIQVIELSKEQPFRSPFSVSIYAKDFVFPRVYRLNATEPKLLYSVLEQLATESKGPVAVLGWVDMPEVDGTALKRAPLADAELGADKNNYAETLQVHDAHVVFFAVVVPPMKLPSKAAIALTETAFGTLPEKGAAPTTLIHVHAALVQEAAPINYETSPLIIEKMHEVTVKDILQIEGASSIQKGSLLVYRMNSPYPNKYEMLSK